MDVIWLTRNLANSWNYQDSLYDGAARFYLLYSPRLPGFLRRDRLIVGFKYPQPVGRVRLLLRANSGADLFIHSEVFEHNYYRLNLPSAPQTILDLGANTGLTSIYLSRCFPSAQLACVEPMPGNLEVLRENLKLNKVPATVISGAADAWDGHVSMQVALKDYGHRVLDPFDVTGMPFIRVPAFSIPTMIQMLGWRRIGLLKIDIEGHEKILLSENATWLSMVDSVCIECHEGYGENDLRILAEKFGFLPPERLPGIWIMRR